MNAATTSRSTHLDDSHRTRISIDYANLGTGLGVGGVINDECNAVMGEIAQRETVCRTRVSVLQSTGKQFEKDINAFLQLMKAKEDGVTGDLSQMNLNVSALTQTSSQQSGVAGQPSSQTAIMAQKSRALGMNDFTAFIKALRMSRFCFFNKKRYI